MTPIMNFKPKIGSDNLADFELCVNLLSMALKPVDSASIGLGGAARLVEKHHISGSGMKAPEIRNFHQFCCDELMNRYVSIFIYIYIDTCIK